MTTYNRAAIDSLSNFFENITTSELKDYLTRRPKSEEPAFATYDEMAKLEMFRRTDPDAFAFTIDAYADSIHTFMSVH